MCKSLNLFWMMILLLLMIMNNEIMDLFQGLQAHQTMTPQFQVQVHPQVQVLQEREED